MTTYKEMCDVAALTRKEHNDYQQRAWGYFISIVKGLVEHCEIPDDRIVYMKWNGRVGEDRVYSMDRDGGRYTLVGAVDFDLSDGFWHLGVKIILTPANSFPHQYVTFLLCVNEQNKVPTVKIGLNAKPRIMHFENLTERDAFCDEIADSIVKDFTEPQKPTDGRIGFSVGTS